MTGLRRTKDNSKVANVEDQDIVVWVRKGEIIRLEQDLNLPAKLNAGPTKNNFWKHAFGGGQLTST